MAQAGHVQIKVSFILQLIDDFTDKEVIDSSIRVTGVNTKPPVQKSGGCYVFINCRGEQTEVHIASKLYLEETIIVRNNNLLDSANVIKVRLKPSRLYPLPFPITCMEGTAQEGKTVGVVPEEREALWKLLKGYEAAKDKECIKIFNPLGKDLERMYFHIMDKDKKNREFFQIYKAFKKDHTYMMDKPLNHNYEKTGTMIYTFFYTRAGCEGTYFLPVKEGIKEPGTYTCYYNGIPKKAVLEPLITNRIDF